MPNALIPKVKTIRAALKAAGFDTPFTGPIKNGYSIKLSIGHRPGPWLNEYVERANAVLDELAMADVRVETKITESRDGFGGESANVVVRVTSV